MKRMKKMISLGLSFLLVLAQIMLISAATNAQEAAAVYGLGDQWSNTPSNWKSGDPCDDNWVGIHCDNSHVTSITLSSLGLEGTLTGDIQSLTELQTLDLSYNKGLTGQIPAFIGSLSKLENLILVGCSFSGEIPAEIGSLKQLIFLSLNSNKFSGRIPSAIGNLAKLYWLDLADNLLTGEIPVSDGKNPGLDMLIDTKHFHFGMNQLSGAIPEQLFSSNMKLIHLLLDNNNLTGEIPSSLGLVKSLEVLRLDRNHLSGSVPSNINNLTKVAEMHLSNNDLTGPLPNLTGMNSLTYLDMSNNTFDESDTPAWFSTLPSLTTLVLEYLRVSGEIPMALFSFSPLQTVRLRNNKFNGTLNIGTAFSSQLELVDVQYNNIELYTEGGGYNNQLILVGNPYCEHEASSPHCLESQQSITPYSTEPQDNCVPVSCPTDQSMSPHCICAYPYSGTFSLRAPSFSYLGNWTYFTRLENDIMNSFRKHQLPVDSVSLNNISTDVNEYLRMHLQVFPSGKLRFEQSDISNIGFILSNQTYKTSKDFGPYSFIGAQYTAFLETSTGGKSSNIKTVIIGVAAGVVVLALILIILLVFLVRHKKKTKNAVERSQPFESWVVTKRSGDAPQLKGARSFSYEEIRKCTSNFAESNEIGTGGYGKVYKGTLENGQLVAIKRAQQGSMQGGLEFKTEIEMLSRVHHKNLVSLIGFCFDKGEQMLIYEYITNGSLKESLTGKSGVQLDWKRRLRVALGAAKGLAYLHDLADPPIIHRDIKSSNILLDNHLNAKVSDFGLSKPMTDTDKGHVTTQVKGTMGYLDPEYYMSQQLTEKSDVYSFGVLLLELLTARKPIERGRYVVREVRVMMNKGKDLYGLDQLLDPILISSSLGGFCEFIDLALSCVEEEGINRPKMSQVVTEIEKIMVLAGMNPIIEAASTSSSYEATTSKSGGSYHPYGNEAFDYSGGAPSAKVEAK
ncbi:Non-specific serine/threonine protein kinase protein [Dioscorea alata]|uniref:Non-specific serine/threonine protein kinase protein n=1 Tax=Dioscorea alata TaxID=55571 RepID=A0ACB7W0X8_DIOAL|nr:Non-specific serine/threonine protein kinase protein [Dioscorea alata]